MTTKRLEDIQRAFAQVSDHAGVPINRVTPAHFRAARAVGVEMACGLTTCESMGRAVGGWGELRTRVDAAGDAPMKEHPVKPVPDGHMIKGASTLFDKDGNVKLQWLKTKDDPESIRFESLSRMIDRLPQTLGKRGAKASKPPRVGSSDMLAIYGVGDAHIGMYAWCRRNGVAWDLDRAESTIVGAVESLSEQGSPAGTALLVNVGDWHHHDGKGVTPQSGHVLDNAGTWQQIVDVSTRTMTRIVDTLLRRHDHVHVINAVGNHDMHSTTLLNAFVRAWYRNEPRVTVDEEPDTMLFYQHGECMIAVTHGDKIKLQRMGPNMATRRPKMWGNTEHRLCISGHVHHEQRKEYDGVVVESLNTLAAPDKYASDNGYNSSRSLSRITYHSKWGYTGRSVITAAVVEAMMRGDA